VLDDIGPERTPLCRFRANTQHAVSEKALVIYL